MGRFGFGKKDRDGEEDSSRLGLFGSRSKSKSPAPPADNPYARASAPLDPYTQAKVNAGLVPPPQNQTSANFPQNGSGRIQSPPGPQGYQGPPSSQQRYGGGNDNRGVQGGYGADRYGDDRGYGGNGAGANPYGNSNNNFTPPRPGGYGGLGKTNTYGSEDNAAEKDELFGGARDRVQQRQQNGPPDYAYNSPDTGAESRSYGAYGDRQLTAEEEEEEDVQAMKQEMKFMRKEDVALTSNALMTANRTFEQGGGLLARLAQQGERMREAEMNLDLADGKVKEASGQTSELHRINGSMFNPLNYTPNTRKNMDRAGQKAVEKHEREKAAREENRQRMFTANEKNKERFKKMGESDTGVQKQKLSERSNYMFEADSDDERDEEQIERNLDDLLITTRKIKYVAKAMGEEIDEQNITIDRIGGKTDSVHENVVRQTARLKRIK